MVFERISNFFGSDNSNSEDSFQGVVGEALSEYDVLEKEYQSDDFFQERIRKMIEEENLSVGNLEVKRGAQGVKLGESVKILGAVAKGIAIKTVVEEGLSKVENDIDSAEDIIEAQDTELFKAEDKIEELEIRIEDMLEVHLKDIKSVSDLESSISKIESNTSSMVSNLEQNSIKNMNEEQVKNTGNQLREVITELKQLKSHQAIESVERKIEDGHVDKEIFNELVMEARRLSENIAKMEEEMKNIDKAINTVSNCFDLVESNSEIWMHNDSLRLLDKNQQLIIIDVLKEDQNLVNLSKFSSFDKRAFLDNLASKNPGDLISESQEFQTRELNSYESRFQEIKSKKQRLEQEKKEIENQLGKIVGNSSEIIEELESIEEYIERLKKPSSELVKSLETEVSEIESMRKQLESYRKARENNNIGKIPEMEKVLGLDKNDGKEEVNPDNILSQVDELLRSTINDLEELLSILDSVEAELMDDEGSVKASMQKLNSLDVQTQS